MYSTFRHAPPEHCHPTDLKSSGHGSSRISGYGQPSFRVLTHNKKRAFTTRSSCDPTFPFLWRYHPEWEIVYIHSGCGTRHVGTSVEKFSPGDLVLLPGNIPHTWYSSVEQTGPSRYSLIHFLPQVWGESFWQLPEISGFHDLCQRAQHGLRFTGAGVEEIGMRMEALAANDLASLESFTEFWKILTLLATLDVHTLNAMKHDQPRSRNPRLEQLLAWVESRLGEPLSQHDAAAEMKMSPAAFSRWFKANMGCVFNRYLNELRIGRVCSDIARGNISITEAAFHAGYNNLSNFNRRFLEVTGLTPKAFRTQIKRRKAC
jgi:AraC-like DNA-binding protein/quercetin dioxygenase-like cupin family protein